MDAEGPSDALRADGPYRKRTTKRRTGSHQQLETPTGNEGHYLDTSFEYNNNLPVHQLPVEIFLDIIHSFLNAHPQGSWLKHMGILSLVCVNWKDAIKTCPSLWTYVTTWSGRMAIENALINSKTHPLCIMINTESRATPVPRMNPRVGPSEFIALLLPHITRWEYFRYVGKDATGLACLEDVEAPILKTLVIELESPPRTPLKLFRGLPATLRKLAIARLPLAWNHHQLNSLRDLSLHWTYAARIPPSTLLHILTNNPDLSSLSLTDLADESSGSTAVFAAPVHLNHLKALTIGSVSRQTLRQVLPNLIIPHCKSIHIELPYSSYHPDTTSPSLETTTKQTLQRVAEHMSSCTLTGGTVALDIIDHGEFICVVELDTPNPGEYRIKTYVASNIADYVAKEFLPRLPNPKVKITDIFFSIYGAEFTWLEAFQHLSTIVSIEIHNEGYDPDDEDEPAFCFGEYISMPNEGEDGVWRWPFPGLERLHFEDDMDDQGVLDAVAHRYQVDGPSEYWNEVELPKPMKSIYMRNVDPGFYLAIKKIVGPSCIVDGSGLKLSMEDTEEVVRNMIFS